MKQPPLLDVDVTARHDEDFYRTPIWQTRVLFDRVNRHWGGFVVEPCVGDGAIVAQIPDGLDVLTNDLVVREPMVPEYRLDARLPETWRRFAAVGRLDVVVTNPPFDVAFDIAQHALEACHVGLALLLRLSWLEPTEDPRDLSKARGPWLAAHPPTRLIVMPRYDYRGNGKTDSVTSAWMVWAKRPDFCQPGVEVVTKAERDALERRAP